MKMIHRGDIINSMLSEGESMHFNEYIGALRGKSVAILGMGISNRPLAKLLLAAGISLTLRDKKEREAFGAWIDELEAAGASLKLGAGYLDDLSENVIFKTPGIRPDIPQIVSARQSGCKITSEMEAFFDVCPCPIIAVTGSDGKTTTATIISKLLREAGYNVHLGGNIGKPLFADSAFINKVDRVVVELSSFQLMTMGKSADVAVVTNVTPNHLDYHRDMNEYISAKMNVFSAQRRSDLLVLNADDPIAFSFKQHAKGEVRLFSSVSSPDNGCFYDGKSVFYSVNGKTELILEKKDISIRGEHNILNLMAAYCAAADAVSSECCRAVAKRFTGVEHRIEPVRTLDGVTFYNDSIATSPTRTIAGLKSFDRKVILIAGGYDKNIPYAPLGPAIKECVKLLVLTGPTSRKIKAAALEAGADIEILEIDDFEAAVRTAAKAAKDGDIVLLSPSSASFDRFTNFEERGNTYKKIVMSL